jgi:hypothetical protein
MRPIATITSREGMKRSAPSLAIVLGLLAREEERGRQPRATFPVYCVERVSRPDIEASLMKCLEESDRFI